MSYPEFDVGQKKEPDPWQAPGGGVSPGEPPKSRGCFFYGCLTLVIVGVLGLLLLIAGIVTLGYFANRALDQYTDTAPATIPVVNLPDDEQKALEERWKAFRKAVEDGQEAEIVLTADEANALIQREPAAKGKVHITIKDDQVTGHVSVPIDLPLKGRRYFNGSGTITAEMEGDRIDIRLRDLEVKGQRLPPEAKAQIGGENLVDEFVKNPENRKLLHKLKRIEVKDNKIHLQSRDLSKEKETEKEEVKKEKEKTEPGEKPKDKDQAEPAPKSEAPEPKAQPTPKSDAPAAEAPAPKTSAA
jgi:hypothetical protein